MRRLADLLKLGDRVYVYVPAENIRRLFLQNAEAEGFTFGDGVKPTKRKAYDDIYALHSDFTISFVGFVGHMWFRQPNASQSKLVRVDYAAYLAGSDDFIVK